MSDIFDDFWTRILYHQMRLVSKYSSWLWKCTVCIGGNYISPASFCSKWFVTFLWYKQLHVQQQKGFQNRINLLRPDVWPAPQLQRHLLCLQQLSCWQVRMEKYRNHNVKLATMNSFFRLFLYRPDQRPGPHLQVHLQGLQFSSCCLAGKNG